MKTRAALLYNHIGWACGSDDSFEAFILFKETTAKIASKTNRMSRTTRIATAVA